MSEIKTEIKRNTDGSYTITDAHSTADVVRWLLTQDDKETILYLLGDKQQRTWVGLTDKEAQWLYDNCRTPSNLIDMVEAKLKEKNNA
jgi:hypothetical protein